MAWSTTHGGKLRAMADVWGGLHTTTYKLALRDPPIVLVHTPVHTNLSFPALPFSIPSSPAFILGLVIGP